MKRLLPLCLALAVWPGGALGDEPRAALRPKDPTCGFLLNGHYLRVDSVTNGLVVNMTVVGSPRVNEPVVLRLQVRRRPGDTAVDDLQVEHEKLMHLIGVRDDLHEFIHLHPIRIAPGIWEITNTFPHGGNYKFWAQVRYLDGSYAFEQPLLTLPGELGAPAPNQDRPDYEVRSGCQITFKHTEPLVSGRTASLQFLIRDAAGRESAMENFLGAAMHLVIIRDDLSVCLHAHPEFQEARNPVITFSEIFTRPGKYKLFAQFRPKGTKLPPDNALLAEFEVNVAPGADTFSRLPEAKAQ